MSPNDNPPRLMIVAHPNSVVFCPRPMVSHSVWMTGSTVNFMTLIPKQYTLVMEAHGYFMAQNRGIAHLRRRS